MENIFVVHGVRKSVWMARMGEIVEKIFVVHVVRKSVWKTRLVAVESTILSGSGMVDSSQFKSAPLKIFVTPYNPRWLPVTLHNPDVVGQWNFFAGWQLRPTYKQQTRVTFLTPNSTTSMISLNISATLSRNCLSISSPNTRPSWKNTNPCQPLRITNLAKNIIFSYYPTTTLRRARIPFLSWSI